MLATMAVYTWTQKGIDMGTAADAEFFNGMAVPAAGAIVTKECMHRFEKR